MIQQISRSRLMVFHLPILGQVLARAVQTMLSILMLMMNM